MTFASTIFPVAMAGRIACWNTIFPFRITSISFLSWKLVTCQFYALLVIFILDKLTMSWSISIDSDQICCNKTEEKYIGTPLKLFDLFVSINESVTEKSLRACYTEYRNSIDFSCHILKINKNIYSSWFYFRLYCAQW